MKEKEIFYVGFDEDVLQGEIKKATLIPFLSALNDFTKNNLEGKLKSILFENNSGKEQMIYFKHFDTHIGTFKMFAFMEKSFTSSWYGYWEIISKMSEFMQFLQENGWIQYLCGETMPQETYNGAREHLAEIFEIEIT
ncbi:MAG: hypothetical protein ACTSUE_13645 [Promethearchaeota archaeon]